MKVKDLKKLILDTFDDEKYDECDIIVPINGNPMEIVGIDNRRGYSKPGGLPFEIIIEG